MGSQVLPMRFSSYNCHSCTLMSEGFYVLCKIQFLLANKRIPYLKYQDTVVYSFSSPLLIDLREVEDRVILY